MTKAEIRSSVRNRLMQIDETAKYHDKVLDSWIERVANQIMHDAFSKNLSNYDFYTKQYENVSLVKSGDIVYALLPANIVQLPDRAEGVRKIQTTTGSGLEFVPVSMEEVELYSALEVGIIDTTIAYDVKQDRVYFWGDLSLITAVDMWLVIPFTEYAETDEFVIPSGKDGQFFDGIVQIALSTPPKDLINDNSDK